MPGWLKQNLESKLLGEMSVISEMQMTSPLCRKQRGTKEPFDEGERGEWKSWLKLNIQKTKIMVSSRITPWQIDGETMGTVTDFIFLDSKITADGDCSHKVKRRLLLGRKSCDQSRQHIKKQRHYFANKDPSGQSYGFSSSHVWMWELVYEESWVLKNWCFWTVVLEKTLESPLDCNESQPVHPKGDQSWVFIGRPDVEAETPILWPPHAKSWLIWKNPDGGKDWRWEEKGTQRMRWLDDHHEFE